MRRPLAASLVLLIAISTVLVPAARAHDSLTLRTDGPWTYKYGVADTDGLVLQEVYYNGKYLLAKGIISGKGFTGCYVYFTDIGLAYFGLPGFLKTE